MIHYIKTIDKLEQAVSYIANQKVVAVDTETTGLDPHTSKVLLVQIGNKENQYVFNVAKLGKNISKLNKIFTSPSIKKILHNAKFDYKMIKSNFGAELYNISDTYLMDCLITQGRPNIRHGLATLLDKYLNIQMGKEEQKSFTSMKYGDEFTESQIKYAAYDIKHLVALHDDLRKRVKDKNMATLADMECECARATGDLEYNGIYLDRAKWLDLKDSATVKANKAKKILDDIFIEHCEPNLFGEPTINYNSPKQLLPILQNLCGPSLTSTGVDVLKQYDHPAIEALLSYRFATKRVTTYGEEFYDTNVNKSDRRIHAQFWQLGRAHTGRYASSNPNMQNIPREAAYRAAFTAQSKEYKIVCADFSGQELRLLAHLSQEPEFLKSIDKGLDLHTNSASLLFDVPYDSVDKKQRTAAKSVTFGLIYGMGPMKLAKTLSITLPQARQLIGKYFKVFRYIKQTMSDLESQAKDTKIALSPLDKRQSDLTHFDWDNPREAGHAINISKNLPFQGTGASTTKLALCRIKRKLDDNNYNAKLINVVHDEILVETHSSCVEEVKYIVEEEMKKGFNYYAPSVAMEVDANVGDFWIH